MDDDLPPESSGLTQQLDIEGKTAARGATAMATQHISSVP
jgi:hypothetical protein